MGAIVAGCDETVETRLGEFGWNLGIAFQLVDDVLDFTSREKILGKPVGNDLREGKVTLPLIYALKTATPDERAMIETVLSEGNYEHVPFLSILQLLHRHHGIEQAMERAQTFTDKARAAMAGFPDSPIQRALLAVTDLVTDRDR
jgi:octaprenyl-diphosphate synthase